MISPQFPPHPPKVSFHFCIDTELETVTATGIANDKTAATRASGWKIYHLDPQLEEMVRQRAV